MSTLNTAPTYITESTADALSQLSVDDLKALGTLMLALAGKRSRSHAYVQGAMHALNVQERTRDAAEFAPGTAEHDAHEAAYAEALGMFDWLMPALVEARK